MTKYGNRKTVVDNITFDSRAEARRYQELQLLVQAGHIHHLVLQPRYQLMPAFIDGTGKKHRAVEYVGDFAYREGDTYVCEDVKGAITKVYAMKRKMFMYHHPNIELREVKA